MMSHKLSASRLEELHQLAILAMKPSRNSRKYRGQTMMMYVSARDISWLTDELKQRRKKPGEHGARKLHYITEIMIAMEIGESVEIEPKTQAALTTLRNTARRRLQIPDARWRCETQPNGLIRMTRMPNGTVTTWGKSKNPAIKQMAAMEVGETIIVTSCQGNMHNGIKVLARKEMDYAEANWKCQNLANGSIRVTRFR